MAELFIERHKGGERVITVHIDFFRQTTDGAEEEFVELVRSAQLDTLKSFSFKKDKPSSKYFVGGGKADDIRQAVKFHEADAVIFDHELSPAQGRNLETLFECRVITRSELILDIFAQRARTYEGKLQVEMAQLQHLSTRLIRGWTHLERQKGGIGLRGPGETQLESDRRLIGDRIKSIKKRLDKVLRTREQGRQSRQKSSVPAVSLVGYTNAGKSTLFNAITRSDVYVEDQLFATLDPTLRNHQLGGMGNVVLADTVGFIRELPHDLVAAFRATLEETRQAELLLHIVDRSAHNYKDTMREVNKVLEEIDAHQVKQLTVYNKIDLLPEQSARIDYDDNDKPFRVWLSAKTGEGLDLLSQAIAELLGGLLMQKEVTLNASQGKLRNVLYKLQLVTHEEVVEEGWLLQINIRKKLFDQLF
ncbi:MAG: GTPase HflX [Coxiella sp. (in: Bacteria)]|nr:MAG: GTPase HflX [Coxiella sp. (in: g-proteobacteria)]